MMYKHNVRNHLKVDMIKRVRLMILYRRIDVFH